MLIDFFLKLKKAKIPVTIKELLDLISALEKHLVFANLDDFYHLSKLILIKNEGHYDKFDRVFASYFEGIDSVDINLEEFSIPEDWLKKELEKYLTEEEKKQIESQGGLQKLMELFQQRLREQKERHQGGNRWIGTGGTSPFGAYGYNPEGFRIGQDSSRHRRAIKVWDQRNYKDLDDDTVLNARNMQVSLKRLRSFAKDNTQNEFDLEETVNATAKNAGYLDIKTKFKRHNAAKVLILFDIGGSMDDYIEICKQLFLAAKSQFKYMHYFYFHNCIYEHVWKTNTRRSETRLSLGQLIRTFDSEYKVILVGDATMSPYEIIYAGGSIEYFNQEPGAYYLQKIIQHFHQYVWINPVAKTEWKYTHSIQIINEIIDHKMYPMTIEGITEAMKALSY